MMLILWLRIQNPLNKCVRLPNTFLSREIELFLIMKAKATFFIWSSRVKLYAKFHFINKLFNSATMKNKFLCKNSKKTFLIFEKLPIFRGKLKKIYSLPQSTAKTA